MGLFTNEIQLIRPDFFSLQYFLVSSVYTVSYFVQNTKAPCFWCIVTASRHLTKIFERQPTVRQRNNELPESESEP